MKLRISRGDADPRDVKMVRVAVPEMLNLILSPSQIDQLDIHINFTSLNGVYGDIQLENPPYFKMRLHNDLDPILLLLTLAHELIHLSQVVSGDLKLIKNNKLYEWHWKKRNFGSEPYVDHDSRPPWEADAERREGVLTVHFVKKYVNILNGH